MKESTKEMLAKHDGNLDQICALAALGEAHLAATQASKLLTVQAKVPRKRRTEAEMEAARAAATPAPQPKAKPAPRAAKPPRAQKAANAPKATQASLPTAKLLGVADPD